MCNPKTRQEGDYTLTLLTNGGFILNKDFIAKHWYASMYEQTENQTNDVDFLLNVLSTETGGTQQTILEVACGGGRICIPLAEAGHKVTAFDIDEHALLRCYRRTKNLPNINIYHADASEIDWGHDFDVVLMAGNLLINIESDKDYSDTQRLFIQKAACALKTGGHLYLDFDLHLNPEKVFNRLGERSYFNGVDEYGTKGKTVSYGSVYNPVTQICSGVNHWELTMNNGEPFIRSMCWYKYIPTQSQVYSWLAEAGFVIERTYHNYTNMPVPEPIDETTFRVTIWARKNNFCPSEQT